MTYEPHITEYKRKEVEDVKRLLNDYPVIAVLNIEGLPAPNYQQIKHRLKEKATIKFTKKVFMLKALEQVKKENLNALSEHLTGVPALLFSKEDPFTLYKFLEKSKVNAPAKAGQKAPNDIVIPVGPTPFTPGPMIGELGQLGIKTEVKEGKIAVKEEKILVKEGEEIKPKVADLLVKLGIQPMKIGINLTLAYENGMLYRKDVLSISEEEYVANLKQCHADAVGLAIFISYTTPETIKLMVTKAYYEARALAETANISTPENISEAVQQAERVAEAVASLVPETPVQQESKQEQAPSPSEQRKQEPPKATNEQIPSNEQKEPSTVSAPTEYQQSASIETGQQEQPKSPPLQASHIPGSVAIESKIPIKEDDMQVAEKILKGLYDEAVKISKIPVKKADIQQETDINKIINALKDKKSRGEI